MKHRSRKSRNRTQHKEPGASAQPLTGLPLTKAKRAVLASALAASMTGQGLAGLRSTPEDVFTRAATLTPSSLDEEARRIQSVLTTEDPAMVYDWRNGRVVLEVLLMSGCQHEDQTPLLRDHNQYSVTSILGSVLDHETKKDELLGWLEFGEDLDETAESIWRRVAQGHLRRVSIGYDYSTADYVTIAAGETATVAGRSFTAPKDRDLRIVKKWRLREVSLVVIPADARAQMREQSQGTAIEGAEESQIGHDLPGPGKTIPPAPSGPDGTTKSAEEDMLKYLKFLHSLGLRSEVTSETEALDWARNGNLTSAQIDQLAKYCEEDGVKFDVASATAKRSQPATTGTRGEGSPERPSPGTDGQAVGNHGSESLADALPGPGRTTADGTTARAEATAAIEAERQRVREIRSLATEHPGVPADVVQRAQDEGWDIARTRSEFLTAYRGSRQEGIAPAGHVRGSEQLSLRVLQAALLEREGITPDSPLFARGGEGAELVAGIARRREFRADWLANVPAAGQRRDDLEQAFDIASQRGLRNASLMRLAEAIVSLETGERLYDDHEILERAFSSGGFSAVYGATVHMILLASYAAAPAAYQEFADTVEVGDFREHQDADMGQVGRLKRQGKNGGEAALLNVEDPELFKILAERYAGILKLTDTMIINDTLGVTGMLPSELGQTCRQMIADLVWAQVLRTDNLADGRTRYNATDDNVISVATFDEAALTSMGVKLKAKKVGNRRIDVNGSVIAAGATHAPTVRKFTASEYINDQLNPHAGQYRTVEDTAIDLGVSDPAQDDADVAGTPNAVYSFATGTKRSVSVAFRRGTNRGPVTRSGQLGQGEWGMYWDVFMDMGAAFRRRVGTVKVNITG